METEQPKTDQTEPPETDRPEPPKIERRKRLERRFGTGLRRAAKSRRRATAARKEEDEERRSETDRRSGEERREGEDRRQQPPGAIGKALSRGVRHLIVVATILVSTGIAWLLYELGHGTRFDSLVIAVWRGFRRIAQAIVNMEPIVAAIVFPLVVFPILIIGFFFYNRGRGG